MSERNVDVVRDQFAAVNERDWKRAMTHYAEDVELVIKPGAFLNEGTFSGREEVGDWFGDWFGTFEPGYHFDLEEARGVGDDRVLLVAIHHGRGRISGADVVGENGYLYTLRDGKVVRLELYASGDEARAAAQQGG